ncbi:MAG: sugar phosphate isomerase/epimerase [Clostridia bacterium]|nr:sugar phosphate isomerase/epimerase [Clostridia bacterium]
MKKWSLGISSCCDGTASRALMEDYAAAGATHMEVSVKPAVLAALDWKQAASDARETGITLWSVHLPFYPAEKANISSMNADIRRTAVEAHKREIARAADAGVQIAVVHPSSGLAECHLKRETRLALAKESLSELTEYASRAGMTLAVENMVRTGLGNQYCEMLDMLSCDERLGWIFDTNHPLLQDPCEYARACVHRMVSIHVSDYDGLNERHWLPGEGVIDWQKLISILDAGGYTGPWMYELGFGCPKSIDRRRITTADFRANYDALMAGEKPEQLGTPIESVCAAEAWLPRRNWN